jgi:hypothetical protein
MAGPRSSVYGSDAFVAFAGLLQEHAPDRPERLAAPCFSRPEPQEMLIEEVEAIWRAIAEDDDWSVFGAKVAAVREAGEAWALGPPPAAD